MNFSKVQKKFIKRNRKLLTLSELSRRTGVPEDDIASYIRITWGDMPQKAATGSLTAHPETHTRFDAVKNWQYFSFFLILILSIYAVTLPYPFVSDDITYLVTNPLIKTPSFITATPLTMLKAFFDYVIYQTFGLNPVFFRLLNILFHIGSVWMLFLIINRLTGKRTAFIASILFAVHPIITESVTWIGGGGYPQLAFFFLASLYFYQLAGENRKFLSASLTMFLCMLLSSEKSIHLSLAIVAYELLVGNLRKNWKLTVPYLALSAIWIFLLLFVFRYAQERLTLLRTSYYDRSSGFYNPLVQLPVAITTYIELLFYPKNLSFYHSDMLISKATYVWKILGLAGFTAALVVSFKKNRTVFFFLMLFIIALLPTLTPFKIAWVVAERYAYLSSAAFLAALAIVLHQASLRFNKRIHVSVFIAFVTVLLITRTMVRNSDWQNQDTLWLATARTAPSDPKTHNNLGDLYGRRGDLNKAREEFEIAIQLNPYYADAYHNLGNVLTELKQYSEAEKSYQKALSINPALWQTYNELGILYYNQGSYDKAASVLSLGISKFPDQMGLYQTLAAVYLKNGDKENAVRILSQALTVNPQSIQVQQALQNLKK